jgi:hypothetical protein
MRVLDFMPSDDSPPSPAIGGIQSKRDSPPMNPICEGARPSFTPSPLAASQEDLILGCGDRISCSLHLPPVAHTLSRELGSDIRPRKSGGASGAGRYAILKYADLLAR